MEGIASTGDFLKAPPTAPKSQLKKKARREGPPVARSQASPGAPGPREERHQLPPISPPQHPPPQHRPAPFKRSYDEYDERDEPGSKPALLGGYPIQHSRSNSPGPIAKYQIRGTGPVPAKTEGSDDQFYAAPFSRFQQVFLSALDSIFANAQNIDQGMNKAHVHPQHPGYRATESIRFQLDRLTDAYYPMVDELEGLEDTVKNFASREDEHYREMAESKSLAFKLSCTRQELNASVSCEEALKRELEKTSKEAAFNLARAKKEVNDLRASHYKLSCAKKDLSELSSHQGRLKRDIAKSEAMVVNLTKTNKELSDQVDGYKAAAAETQERLRLLTAEVEDLQTKRKDLETLYQERQSERVGMIAEKHYLEKAIRERDEEIAKAAGENLRLQSLVQQKDADAEKARSERLRLQGVVRDREAAMAAQPITPLSPLMPHGHPSVPGAPLMHFPWHAGHAGHAARTSPAPSAGVYIKEEAPDQTSSATSVTPQNMPVDQPPEPAQQLSELEAGLVDILGKAFQINRPRGYHNVVISFIRNLGAAPDPSHINVTPAADYWWLMDSWTTTPLTPASLRPTLEEQFAQVLLLFPSHADSTWDDEPATVSLLVSLLTSLITADHARSPRAGLAFLQTMSALPPPEPTATTATTTTTTPHLTTPNAIVALMLAELCRTLQHSFPSAPASATPTWNVIARSILGLSPPADAAAAAAEKMPPCLAQLATALSHSDRSTASIKARLAAGCGDRFCSFLVGGGGGPREMGLLHCDAGRFLMVDFAARSLRLVDCGMADMERNAAERRRWDLRVLGPRGAGGDGDRDGDGPWWELEAAPGEVAAFWVKWVYG